MDLREEKVPSFIINELVLMNENKECENYLRESLNFLLTYYSKYREDLEEASISNLLSAINRLIQVEWYSDNTTSELIDKTVTICLLNGQESKAYVSLEKSEIPDTLVKMGEISEFRMTSEVYETLTKLLNN